MGELDPEYHQVYKLTAAYRNVTETMSFDDSFSPLLHRIDHAIRWRAIHPNEPVPPPPERLTKLAHPPEELQERAKKYLERLVSAADVKKGSWHITQAYLFLVSVT